MLWRASVWQPTQKKEKLKTKPQPAYKSLSVFYRITLNDSEMSFNAIKWEIFYMDIQIFQTLDNHKVRQNTPGQFTLSGNQTHRMTGVESVIMFVPSAAHCRYSSTSSLKWGGIHSPKSQRMQKDPNMESPKIKSEQTKGMEGKWSEGMKRRAHSEVRTEHAQHADHDAGTPARQSPKTASSSQYQEGHMIPGSFSLLMPQRSTSMFLHRRHCGRWWPYPERGQLLQPRGTGVLRSPSSVRMRAVWALSLHSSQGLPCGSTARCRGSSHPTLAWDHESEVI